MLKTKCKTTVITDLIKKSMFSHYFNDDSIEAFQYAILAHVHFTFLTRMPSTEWDSTLHPKYTIKNNVLHVNDCPSSVCILPFRS